MKILRSLYLFSIVFMIILGSQQASAASDGFQLHDDNFDSINKSTVFSNSFIRKALECSDEKKLMHYFDHIIRLGRTSIEFCPTEILCLQTQKDPCYDVHGYPLDEKDKEQHIKKISCLVSLLNLSLNGDSIIINKVGSRCPYFHDKPCDLNQALINAWESNNLLFVKILIENGASANLQNAHGETLLHHSAFYGDIDMVEFLLAKGAHTDIKNAKGLTAYQMLTLPDRPGKFISKRRDALISELLSLTI